MLFLLLGTTLKSCDVQIFLRTFCIQVRPKPDQMRSSLHRPKNVLLLFGRQDDIAFNFGARSEETSEPFSLFSGLRKRKRTELSNVAPKYLMKKHESDECGDQIQAHILSNNTCLCPSKELCTCTPPDFWQEKGKPAFLMSHLCLCQMRFCCCCSRSRNSLFSRR